GRVGLGRLAARRQLLEELGRGPGDGGHRLLEGGLGGRGRKGDPADLADVLAGGGLDLLAGGRRLETPEGGDVAAHGPILGRGRVTPSLPDPAGALVSLWRDGQDATVGGGGRCAVGARGTEGERGGGAAGAARPARGGRGRAVAAAPGAGGGGGVRGGGGVGGRLRGHADGPAPGWGGRAGRGRAGRGGHRFACGRRRAGWCR